jgi:hypothetical protein
VGPLERRLSRLEKQVVGWADSDTLLIYEALSRLTEEDVHLLTAYLDRGGEEYAEPSEDEEAVLVRLEERFEEVKNGH